VTARIRRQRRDGHVRKRMDGAVRHVFLWLVPVALIAGGIWVYIIFGRYAYTDDAYVQADKTLVAPQVSGNILKVNVHENEHVTAGQVLLEIENEAARLAVERARAQLDAARTSIEALKSSYVFQAATAMVADEQAEFAKKEWERQRDLAKQDMASKADLDKAEQNYKLMYGLALVIREQMRGTAVRLSNNPNLPVEQHPDVQAAAVDLQRAELDLERTRVLAPRPGVVSRLPFVGDHVSTGVPALAIVDNSREWIEANFKETDLTRMQVGQKVDIDIDTYPDHTWQGHVESIAQATGAEFALLPPQNASGNWVKVVQRIPVRIAFEHEDEEPALRVGMSAQVRVHLAPRQHTAVTAQAN